jgi:hypothetical protein
MEAATGLVESSLVSDWERGFCASVIRQSRRGGFAPTDKQVSILRRLASKWWAEGMADSDGEVIE